MRKEIIEYAKTVTCKTPIEEVAEVVETIEELEYLLKTLENDSE